MTLDSTYGVGSEFSFCIVNKKILSLKEDISEEDEEDDSDTEYNRINY